MPLCTSGTAIHKADDAMKTKSHTPFYSELDSAIGVLWLLGDGERLTGLYMHEQRHRPILPDGCERNDKSFRDVRDQLKAYFAGKLQRFEVVLAGEGSPFQRTVWKALCKIPYGV